MGFSVQGPTLRCSDFPTEYRSTYNWQVALAHTWQNPRIDWFGIALICGRYESHNRLLYADASLICWMHSPFDSRLFHRVLTDLLRDYFGSSCKANVYDHRVDDHHGSISISYLPYWWNSVSYGVSPAFSRGSARHRSEKPTNVRHHPLQSLVTACNEPRFTSSYIHSRSERENL